MSEIHVIARFKIHPGRLEDFRAAAEECKRTVREKDENTLMYEWFLDETKSECIVLERYADSDGLLEHISHVGDALGALLDASEVSIEQLGDQSEKLLEVTRPYGPRVYWPF